MVYPMMHGDNLSTQALRSVELRGTTSTHKVAMPVAAGDDDVR